MNKKYCRRCHKRIPKKKGNQGYPKVFCSKECQTRFNANLRHLRNKNNPSFKKQKYAYFKKWYKKNKARQKANVLRDYHNNKAIWAERRYINSHRTEILELINKKCAGCGKARIEEIHHEGYDFPKRKRWKSRREAQRYLIQYCKKLVGFCSRKCHKKYEARQGTIKSKYNSRGELK